MTTHDTLYVSTAIPFVNARPHLGFALELCIADTYARHARARGADVRLVSGTDDHSLKNVLAAERAGHPTSRFVAEQAERFRQLAAALGVSFDRFIQTSQSCAHRTAVEALWKACLARGDLYRKAYRGLYCVGCERFADPSELRCPEHETPLEWVEEHNWFFRLSRYADLVRERITSAELTIHGCGAREETLGFLREPLRDLCVSRSAERARGWGLRVPGDETQVIWVWFDALAYYLSALGYAAADGGELTRFWEQGRRLQIIGKGVARFHAVFWPAFLSSAGLSVPDELLVHGYLTLDGAKISKSGRTLDPLPLIEEFGSDAVRYYLLRHVRTGRDGDFSRERLIQAYNAELANGLGNLASRILGLVQRATGGRVPEGGPVPSACELLEQHAHALPGRVDDAIAARELDIALDAIFDVVHAANRCIDQTAPWALIKQGDLTTANHILRSVLGTLHILTTELTPFLPHTAAALRAALQRPLAPTLKLFPRVEVT